MNHAISDSILLLLEPIGAQTPAGFEIEYDEIYERIRQAREQDDDIISDGEWACEARQADWSAVVSLSCEALTSHSKHFQIASWLIEGWLKKQGIAGLEQGLELLNGMQQLWWQEGFPALAEEGETFRLAIFNRLDRDLSKWLLTESPTGAPQCSLAWWHKVLRHEHLTNHGSDKEAESVDEEFSLEHFQRWAMRSLPQSQLQLLQQQIADCQMAAEMCEKTLCALLGHHEFRLLPKAREALEEWQGLLSRITEWVAPQASLLQLDSGSTLADDGAKPAETRLATSRETAINQMLLAAQYFRQHEPSSPVPMLMDRAVRWANMSLAEWLEEMVRDEGSLREINHVLKGPEA
jgi:type VI secretion system protein ImpA